MLTNDGVNGYELWKSDGTSAGTALVKDINPGSASGNPTYLMNLGGTLYFRAQDGSAGYELWKSDGTSAGTVLVKDINPGSASGGPKYLTNVSGTLFFRAQDGSTGYELWKSDGTSAGTTLVKDIRAGASGSAINQLTNVNGVVFFQANEGAASGYELWKSDGTSAGTVLVKDINPGALSSNPKYLTEAGGLLFFQANDGTSGSELWQTDGTSSGTVLTRDILAGSGTSSPKYLTNVNGSLFFRACDLTYGFELWGVAASSMAPTTLDLDAASDSGASTTDNLTSDTTPTLTGTAEAGSTVELLEGATVLGTTTADGSGNWTITSVTLGHGVHALFARASNGSGSASSSTLAVTIDTTAPTVSAPDLSPGSDSGSSSSDNLTSDTTPTLTGTAEAGSAVTLLEGATVLGSATADGSGNWTITTSALSAGAHSLTARATDAAGNVADSGALTVTIDTTQPAVSTPDLSPGSDSGSSSSDDLTSDTTPTFTGTAEAGSLVELLEGATVLGSATADGSGHWTITSVTLGEDVHSLVTRATDAAGNITDSGALSVTIDTTPSAVSTPDLVASSDSGSSSTDNLTSRTTPTFTGTAEAGRTVELREGATVLGSTTADGSGNWSITLTTPLTAGVHNIFARSTDLAGNQGNTAALAVTIDTTTATPTAPDLSAGSDSGSSSSDNLTSATTPTFTGTAEAGSTVTLLEGATVLGTATADGSGNWSITSVTLGDGVHAVLARATDGAGNQASSSALTVTIDTTAPAVSAPDLSAGSDSGSSSSDNLTSATTPTFTGTAEAGSTVTLREGATVLGTATADGSGNWVISSSALAAGPHTLSARATDAAGNVATSSALTVTIDTTPPAVSAPDLSAGSDSGSSSSDNLTSDTTPTFTGTAEASSTVTLREGSTVLGSATADGAGNWTITAAALGEGTHGLVARATDAAGNFTDSAVLSVTVDTTPPAVSDPDLDPASDDGLSSTDNFTSLTTPVFTGATDPGAAVELREGTTLLGSTTADGAGNWTITSATLTVGEHQLFARATDAAGNSADSGFLVVTIVTLPAVSIPDLVAGSDSGSSSSDNLTSSTTPTFTGTADAGSTVELREGTTVLGTTTADGAGNWSITSTTLSEGIHNIVARATVGALSNQSNVLAVTIDTTGPGGTAPDLVAASDSGSSGSDDLTSLATPTFTGTTEANTAVTLFDGATTLGTTTSDASGRWSIASAALTEGPHSVFARTTDRAGNVSDSAPLTVTIDATPPAVSDPDLSAGSDTGASATDDLTSDTTPTLTGTAEAGSTVELREGTTVLGTATADGAGNWSLTAAALSDGVHSLVTRATDAAGNFLDSGALTVTIDTTPPAVSTPDLSAGSDSGSSSSDNLTSDTTPTFTGTAEAGSTVELRVGTTVLGSATADGSGNWSITSLTLSEGAHSLVTRATDAAGNVAESTALSVTIDTTPPAVSAPDLDPASDSGASATDNVTSDTTPTFTGTAEAGSGVELREGATVLGSATADGSGHWTITSVTLGEGVHSLVTRATDEAGNVATSSALTVTIDTTPPAVSAPDLSPGSDSGSSSSDDLTSDTRPTFTGTAEAGSTVELREGATILGSATAGGAGTWTITSAALTAGVHSLVARATDAAGNVASSATLTVTIDTTAPAVSAPDLTPASDTGASSSDNLTSSTTPTFTGTAEAGSAVEIREGTTVLGTATADGSGNWSITTSALSDGAHSLAARATDAAGNFTDSSALAATIDATPPAVSAPDLSPASDSGASATDNLTSDTTPTFTGTAEVGSTVELREGTTVLGSTTANGSGNWIITSVTLGDGVHSLVTRATDAAGNFTNSTALAVTIDTAPPTVSAPDLSPGSDLGASATDNLTSATTPTFTGTAEAGSGVELREGTTVLGTATADSAGNWSITSTTLTAAVHTLTARATDTAGNVATSSALTVTIDTTAPTVSTPDLSPASDTGSSSSDNLTSDTTPTLTGTAEAGSTVELREGATVLGSATADGSGNWTITSVTLSDGTHSLTARATDAAGNFTNSGALAVTIDATPPAVSTPDLSAASDSGSSSSDNLTSDTTPTLTGTAEAGSTVELREGATVLGTVTANGSGVWAITPAALAAGPHTLSARATDAAGNVADSSALTVTIDTTAPAVSTPDLSAGSDSGSSGSDNLTSSTTPTFTGTAEAGSTVEVREGATVLGTTTADGSGNWTITTSALSNGLHSLAARATDAAGNFATSSTLAVTIDTTPPTVSDPDLDAGSDDGVSSSDNFTTVTTPTFTGTAEAGSTIELREGATVLGSTTADGAGTWSITSTTLTDGEHLLYARAADAAGNVSDSGFLVVTIVTPPVVSIPDLSAGSDSGSSSTDNLTSATTPTFTGTTTAGSTVDLMEGTTVLGTATADASGNWTITSSVPLTPDGVHSIFARATLLAVTTDSIALPVTIDATPPAVSTPDLVAGSDSGPSSSDDLTSDTTPTFSGTAEAGSTVELLDGATVLGTTTTDAGGTWSITSAALAEGDHSLVARATDKAGNVATSAALAVTIDTTPPTVSAPDLTPGSDSGSSLTDNLTSDTTPTFTGTAEAGRAVELREGTTVLGTTTSNGAGRWTITIGPLSTGPHAIRARATDLAGNFADSSALTVTIDTTPPAVSAPDLSPGSDLGASATDDLTSSTTPTFTGTAEAGSTIELLEGATVLDTTTADGAGNWTLTASALGDGPHSLVARATDAAGNAADSGFLVVTIDATPPVVSAPDLSPASDTGASAADDLTSDTTPTFTGTAEAGTTVELREGTTVLGSATADGSGNWTITAGALTDGSHAVFVRATDVAGNSADSASLTVTIDTAVSPAAPDLSAGSDSGSSTADDLTSDTTPTFTGSTEANSTVELRDGATVLGSTTADGSGNWSITSTALTEGGHAVFVRVTDAAGNSADSALLTVTIDTTTPATSAPDLSPTSDTGASAADDLTSDTTPTFTGTAEAGSTVTLFEGATPLGSATADGSGNWTITAGTLTDGGHAVFVRATDAAGNSADSAPLTVTIDTTPPAASAPDLDPASDTGASGSDDVTSSITPTFSGTAEAGSAVEIREGATVLGSTTADGSGNWTLTVGALSEGDHTLAVRATDAAGNVTDSTPLTVTTDVTLPTVSAPDLSAGSDLGASATDDLTSDATPTFTGTAEAGSTVELFEGATLLGSATADGAGNWTITSVTLSDGAHNLTIRATDAAGNAADSGLLVVTIDATPPAVSAADLVPASDSGASATDNLTSDATPTFTGTAEAGSLVEIREGATVLGTATADGSGNWTITAAPLTEGSHAVTVRATDAAGNATDSAPLSVTIDATPPSVSTPDLSAASDGGASGTDNVTEVTTPTFTGTAEAGSTVELFEGATLLGSATADPAGAWSITVTLTEGAHTVVARGRDRAGNVRDSAALTVTVVPPTPTPEPQPEPQPEPTGGQLGGTVYLDYDADGVRDGVDGGLGGRTVYLDLDGDARFSPGEPAVTTDEDGTYLFTDLPAGTYTIRSVLLPGEFATRGADGLRADVGPGAALSGLDLGRRTPDPFSPAAGTANPFPGDAADRPSALTQGLYRAFLDRAPESFGLGYWTAELAEGRPPAEVVGGFLNSAEYHTELVRRLYRSYLGRDAEALGLDFWVSRLQGGLDETEVIAGILGSDEYLTRNLDDGGFLRGLYRDTLGREADPEGLAYWTGVLEAGTSRRAVALSILRSAEAFGRALDTFYAVHLGRQAEEAGRDFWLGQLEAGSRQLDEVLAEIFASDESLRRLGPLAI